LERTLDTQVAQHLLEAADLGTADEATFFARYFFLFVGDDQSLTGPLNILMEHSDWRVRAALADGIRDQASSSLPVARSIMDRLVHDTDYKVRAAVARAIGGTPSELATRYLATLLNDDNWHVCSCVLQSIMSSDAESHERNEVVSVAVEMMRSEANWQHCPAHVAALKERLFLLRGAPSPLHQSPGRTRAVFMLLREVRTGWTRLPSGVQDALVVEGHRSLDWLVQREADAFADARPQVKGPFLPLDAPSLRDAYRRLRNRRSVQVALDLHDLDQAVAVARAAAAAGIDFIEVGDPLIKAVGINAVEQIKRSVPQVAVVAEMMSADWGRDQVILAAAAGADVVFLIGPATAASVSAAAEAGRRLGVPILLDVPTAHTSEHWIRDMERAGVDGFAITTNIDIGVGGRHPLAKARAIRHWTQLPVAVSGGFSATDHAIIGSADWDIMIVGRSVTEAAQPTAAAKELFSVVHRAGVRRVNDRDGT
jgi:3-keto-L-gulonate-6-phosphate decarboxylase